MNATEHALNLPLDVVDTGSSGYSARIENNAGIDVAMCFSHDDATAIVEACNSFAALSAHNRELVAALKKYAVHLPDCPAWRMPGDKCSCGLAEVLGS